MKRLFLILLIIGLAFPTSAYRTNIQFRTLDGNTASFSDYQGNILLVEGMTTWCDICKKEMAELREIYDIVEGKNVKLLSLSLDLKTDNAEKLQAYKEKHNALWDFGLDHTESFMNDYDIDNYPGIVLFDENGDMIKRWEGYFVPAHDILVEIDKYVDLDYEGQRYTWQDIREMLTSNVIIPIFLLIAGVAIIYSLSKLIGNKFINKNSLPT